MAMNPTDPNAGANQSQAGDDAAAGTSQPNDRLDQTARSTPIEELARQHGQTGVVPHRAAHKLLLLADLKEMELFVRDATVHFRAKPAQEPLSYAAEWMLDNFYLVEQSFRQTREDMPPGFYRQLPKLATGALEGYPRIYAVAQELVAASGAHLELDRIERFIHL